MIHVAEQQAFLRAVNDDADIRTDAHGPEVLIARPVEPVELQARAGRIHLQVESRRLDRLLLVAAQPDKTIGEGIGDAEFHQRTRKIFITSSPRWLITLTAMRPEAGLSNGREVSLRRDSHASASISALSVVLSAL